jgi:hypothetical protein
MRKFTCDYLEAHEADLGYWASYCSFMDGEDYAGYVKRMRKSGMSISLCQVTVLTSRSICERIGGDRGGKVAEAGHSHHPQGRECLDLHFESG